MMFYVNSADIAQPLLQMNIPRIHPTETTNIFVAIWPA